MGLKAKEIEPNAAEMAAANEMFERVTECFKTRAGGVGPRSSNDWLEGAPVGPQTTLVGPADGHQVREFSS